MKTITEKTKTLLVKKFHVLLGKAGIDNEGKRELLAAYGVGSTLDLDTRELLDLCERIECMMDERKKQENAWRKRVIACLFAWCKAMGTNATMDYVKAIACRSAEADHFNDIPLERLRSIYYAFCKKTKDLQFAEQLTADELSYKAWVN